MEISNTTLTIAFIVLLIVLGAGAYWYVKKDDEKKKNNKSDAPTQQLSLTETESTRIPKPSKKFMIQLVGWYNNKQHWTLNSDGYWTAPDGNLIAKVDDVEQNEQPLLSFSNFNWMAVYSRKHDVPMTFFEGDGKPVIQDNLMITPVYINKTNSLFVYDPKTNDKLYLRPLQDDVTEKVYTTFSDKPLAYSLVVLE